MRGKGWLVPLTGLAFVVIAIIAFAVGGEPPDADAPAGEIAEFYADNEGTQMFGGILTGVAATVFVFFGGVLHRTLRRVEGQDGFLAHVAFAGIAIFALGLAIDGTITFALADTAQDIDPTAVQALLALWHNDFLPFAVGLQTFLLATGITVVARGGLPKWIGWVAIVLAVVAMSPLGFLAFLGTGVLVAIMSVMMTLQGRPAAPVTPE